ncbi:transcriptional regulator family: Fungal Specific TF [Penicillium paradoxum]|uniref:transcriptional regulator family: Fungal Specific TF n=1 Tax=Penicillium paradoxum TaxID=176176 RepID=UPI00254765BA|nr:transcriptional regulator family: Fungal Specific TF [Penicillium paradoxum]KAJ5772772.1 transcriptional regulator family: Fungal Specific TF [Penicillium paradoxum]
MENHDSISSEHEETDQSRAPQRRRRPPLSCTVCRKRKLKCDRAQPCGQCVRSKTAAQCVFVGTQLGPVLDSGQRMSPPQAPNSVTVEEQSGRKSGMFVFDSKLGPNSTTNRVSKRTQPDELRELRTRLRNLENSIGKPSHLHTPETSVGDVLSEAETNSLDNVGVEDRVRFLPECSFRGKKTKTRYFGRSHYTTTVSFFHDIGTFMRRGNRHGEGKDEEYTDMKQFKTELWSRESQDHQREFREQAFKLKEMVPQKHVADHLLQLYLDTFEMTYRILHTPTFLKQYAELWANPQFTDMAFVAQLLAIMAAGSCFYAPSAGQDHRDVFQKPALKWIMAVQSFISCTFISPDIDFRMLQTQALLLVARLGVASDGDVAWASAGWLIRSATTMGLHRDPTRFHKLRPFYAELRRRLWATIVELDLKISLDRGVPPSVDLDECDCDAPSNWDDADMIPDMENNPAPRSTALYTQNFYQTLLTKTLPLRFRIAKKVNSLSFDLSYDDALKMGDELSRSMQQTSSLFEENAPGPAAEEAERHRFAQSLHLFIMRKFLLALHRPFSLSVVRLPKCSYSRKVCLEESLGILSQMELPPPTENIIAPHITQLGSGMFRDETFHAAVTVCVELSLQANEMRSSTTAGMDGVNSSVLMSMIQSQQGVMMQAIERTADNFGRRIDVGGKGSKPFFFLNIILASVKSRVKGEDPLCHIEAASKRSVRICRAILNGLIYEEARIAVDSGLVQTPVPSGLNSVSATPSDLDAVSFLFNDLTDFAPMDLGGWLGSSENPGPEVWDWDANLSVNLPTFS